MSKNSNHVSTQAIIEETKAYAREAIRETYPEAMETEVSKMRMFLSDVMFERERDGKKRVAIPFGRQDCTVFRKVMSAEDTIQEFAPALRTGSQVEALRIALQTLGDLCGFGITYFDFDDDHHRQVPGEEAGSGRGGRDHERRRVQAALVWRERG